MDKTYPSTNSLPLPAPQGPASASVGGEAEKVISKDPLAPIKAAIPVSHSSGDSPIIRSAAYCFRAQNPYDRAGEISPSPATPNDSNPTRVK
jgi:hypothetical protein